MARDLWCRLEFNSEYLGIVLIMKIISKLGALALLIMSLAAQAAGVTGGGAGIVEKFTYTGGGTPNSVLHLRSTSGAGTTNPATTNDTISFERGNNGSQQLGIFSPGGSLGIGDFTDGTLVNIHGGDDGTTTRVVSVRAKTAPLFIGYTDRDNSESGGAIGRSVASFEGYRLANTSGSRESGALRVITEGVSATQLGSRVSIMTRRDGFDESDFVERWSVQNDGNVYHGGGAGGVGSANRNGYSSGTTVYTISGQTGRSVIEMTTAAADADALVLGEISGIANYNTDSKRIALIQYATAGSTATKRGGAIKMYAKVDNGSLTEQFRISQWGPITAGPIGALQQAPTLTITTNNITPTAMISFLGAGLVKNIVVPSNFAGAGGRVTIIPTAAFTTDTTGNIAIASTATIGRAMDFIYDAGTAKWYPSY
jgi:hypothetical protein